MTNVKGGIDIFTVITTLVGVAYFGWFFKSFYNDIFPNLPPIHNAEGEKLPVWKNYLKPGKRFSLVYEIETKKPIVLGKTNSVYQQNSVADKFRIQILKNDSIPATGEANLIVSMFDGSKFLNRRTIQILSKENQSRPLTYRLYSNEVCFSGEKVENTTRFRRSHHYKSQSDKLHLRKNVEVHVVFDETEYLGETNQYYVPQIFLESVREEKKKTPNHECGSFYEYSEDEIEIEISSFLISRDYGSFKRVMRGRFGNLGSQLGEKDAREMQEMLFETDPKLLTGTFVLSALHSIFEVLALKSDILFWSSTPTETIQKYISIQSVAWQIPCQFVVLLSYIDTQTMFLMILFQIGTIFVSIWKIQKTWFPSHSPRERKKLRREEANFKKKEEISTNLEEGIEETENIDKRAMRILYVVLTPIIVSYAVYSFFFDCYRGWYSYILNTLVSLVYGFEFILMTPQLFINYKLKSVAFLPWRMFIYKALNTFVDDLFAFIITMPTIHRVACFRDDIVFLIFLYQRWLYGVDKERKAE